MQTLREHNIEKEDELTKAHAAEIASLSTELETLRERLNDKKKEELNNAGIISLTMEPQILQERLSNEKKEALNNAEISSLTQELQTLRERLNVEKESHTRTKEFLTLEEAKSTKFMMKFQQLNLNMEEHARDLKQTKKLLQEAENDAEDALALAKDSDEKITEMEELLIKALDEVEKLRNSSVQQQTKLLQDIPAGKGRAAAALGRYILRQRVDVDDVGSVASINNFEGSTISYSSYLANLTQKKCAEYKQRLQESRDKSNDPTGKEVICYP